MEEEADLDLCLLLFLFILIKYHNSIRNRSYLTRNAVLSPSASPWKRLLEFADEGSFLNVTGFNRLAFAELVSVLFTDLEFEERIPGSRKRGRATALDIEGQVGLYLFYVGSTLKTKTTSCLRQKTTTDIITILCVIISFFSFQRVK